MSKSWSLSTTLLQRTCVYEIRHQDLSDEVVIVKNDFGISDKVV